MAKNDTVLLDGIIDDRLAQQYPSSRRDEVFELFCFEQLLKDSDLSRDEIDSGWVDGRDDGGIDGFFIFVNGILVTDTASFAWPRSSTEVVVHIATCKHHDTFQQDPLNSLVASLQELLDLSLDSSRFSGQYSQEVLDVRQRLFHVYRKLSMTNPSIAFRFYYASRGDTTQVANNVRARAEQIRAIPLEAFSSSSSTFHFVGSAELVALHRRTKKFSLTLGYAGELKFVDMNHRDRASYVLLVPLRDYVAFVTDEGGAIRRYLFDSNVRDYLGPTAVNDDILASLGETEGPDFWWLNNGVTILARDARPSGNVLVMEDIQIVNGLQTTESIYRHFQSAISADERRSVLVRVLVSTDSVVRDRIIRATNNQTAVETAALRATDKIQRDIEQILERHGWFYERRKNYYRNIGQPFQRFVTPLFLAGGAIALVLREPVKAAKLKARFMRDDARYSKVFSEATPLLAWVRIVELLKRAEATISATRSSAVGTASGERLLHRWRGTLALVVLARALGTFAYSSQQLAGLSVVDISDEAFREAWDLIRHERTAVLYSHNFQGQTAVGAVINEAASAFGIAAVQAVDVPKPPRPPRNIEFLDRVDAELPVQPWPHGIHLLVAEKLGSDPNHVYRAIRRLMHMGRRAYQQKGVVFGRVPVPRSVVQEAEGNAQPANEPDEQLRGA